MDDLPYLLTAREIEAFPGTAKTHYLNEMAQRTNKSLGDLTGLQGFGIHLIEVHPGHLTTEHHVHYFEDECIYVLEGTATALIARTSTLSARAILSAIARADLPIQSKTQATAR